jgi:soluble cytochrome b562
MTHDEVHEMRGGVSATLHLLIKRNIWGMATVILDNCDVESFTIESRVYDLLKSEIKDALSKRSEKDKHHFYQDFKSLAPSQNIDEMKNEWEGTQKYIQMSIGGKNYRMSQKMNELVNNVFNQLPRNIKNKMNSSKEYYDETMLKLIQAVDKKGVKDLTHTEILGVMTDDPDIVITPGKPTLKHGIKMGEVGTEPGGNNKYLTTHLAEMKSVIDDFKSDKSRLKIEKVDRSNEVLNAIDQLFEKISNQKDTLNIKNVDDFSNYIFDIKKRLNELSNLRTQGLEDLYKKAFNEVFTSKFIRNLQMSSGK